jgi:2-(1,2-epoxy-1,2-dihydrophenyl)acetyl-CoA isomerase
MMLGERLDAETCLRLGLLNWLVEADALQQRTSEIANRLARGPRLALRHIKKNLNIGESKDLLDAMDSEVVLHKECGITEDHREAVSAFLERRPANFRAAASTN